MQSLRVLYRALTRPCIVVLVALSLLVASGPKIRGAARYSTAGWTAVDPPRIPEPELILPAEIDPQQWETARCNDGTPFGFMLDLPPIESKTWILYLEGGGFCEDQAFLCSSRKERLTTTPGPKAIEDYYEVRGNGLLSRNPAFNPSFYDANVAWAFYCSSDVWSGGTVERRPTSGDPEGWYFSGRASVQAMIEVLQEYHGLDDSDPGTEVLFVGSSAGGEGIQATADVVKQSLPGLVEDGRLKLLNDAGSIFHFSHPDYRFAGTDLTFLQVMMQAYEYWGSTLNPLCEAAFGAADIPPGACFHEVLVVPFIIELPPNGLGLPLFVQHSSIDRWQLRQHGAEDPEGKEIFRSNTLAQLNRVAWTWLWSGGEFPYHVLTLRNDLYSMGPPGQRFHEVLSRYWQGYPPEVVIYGNP